MKETNNAEKAQKRFKNRKSAFLQFLELTNAKIMRFLLRARLNLHKTTSLLNLTNTP